VTPGVLEEYLSPLRSFSKTFGRSVVLSAREENLNRLPKEMELYKGGF